MIAENSRLSELNQLRQMIYETRGNPVDLPPRVLAKRRIALAILDDFSVQTIEGDNAKSTLKGLIESDNYDDNLLAVDTLIDLTKSKINDGIKKPESIPDIQELVVRAFWRSPFLKVQPLY